MEVETIGDETWSLVKVVAKFPLKSLDKDFIA